MKKILLGAVAIGAIAAGLYYQQSNTSVAHIKMAELDYVPADTLFFASQLTPFPYEKYSALLPQLSSAEELGSQYEEIKKAFEGQGNANPSAAFMLSLLAKYEQATLKQQGAEVWGLGNELRYLTYAIGLMPVVKLELANPQTFIDTVKASADESGISYSDESLNNVAYTRVKMPIDETNSIDLVVAKQGNWLTLTLDTALLTNQDDLAIALGTKKPATALSATTRLQDYTNKYEWDGSSVNFIDNTALVSALVNDKPSRLSQMIDTILSTSGNPDALAMIRTPGCKADLPQIAAKFPAIVSGTKKLEVTDTFANIDADLVLESTDADLLGAMTSIRGFIPSYVTQSESAMLSVGYGIDVSKVAAFTNTIWQSFTKAEFQCEPLIMAQQQAKQANPMAIAMATGMFSGIKGFSVSINDMNLDLSNPDMPDLKEFNGIVTLSADDPMTLINTAKSFAPELAQIEIPDDGTAVSISELAQGMELPIDAKLAVNGNHITLYSGDSAAKTAQALKSEALVANGLVGVSVQLEPFMKLLVQASEASGEELPPEFKALAEQNISSSVTTDINKHGLQLSSSSHIRKD